MNIKLIRPNYKSHLITPPLGLGYISSYLKSKHHKVTIIDGLNRGLSNDEIAKLIRPDDIVGIFCMTAYFGEVIDLCLKLKENFIIIGGPHATCLPEETLKMTRADCCIIGEGEETFAELLSAIEAKQGISGIPGVYTYRAQLIERPFIQNLDSLPFPEWDQIDPRTYQKAPHGAFIKNFPIAPITSSRGCPYNCSFCASPRLWKRTIRFRSPNKVVDEIEMLVKDFGVKEIHFEDDNLTMKRDHIVGICNEIIKRNIKISIACPNGVRSDKIDRELLKLMKKAGFYYLAFGVESGNAQILKNIKKHTSPDIQLKAIAMAEEEGFMTQGFFIFGLPGETKETIEETINYAKKSKLSRAQFLLLDTFPGSELYDVCCKAYDYSKESYHEVTWCPPTVDLKTLQSAPSRAFRSFFLRPKQMWSLIKYFKFSQLPFLLKRLKDFKILPIILLCSLLVFGHNLNLATLIITGIIILFCMADREVIK